MVHALLHYTDTNEQKTQQMLCCNVQTTLEDLWPPDHHIQYIERSTTLTV